MDPAKYSNPLISRYASAEMSHLFSDEVKFRTWRRCWVALAEAEKELGLPITSEQIAELRSHMDELDLDAARKAESELRHDVLAHIQVYGQQCPKAKPIIHLGATSCYVTDNTDLIVMRDALKLVLRWLVNVAASLSDFAMKYRHQPLLGYTHFQPAQPVTLGKRAAMWLADVVMDIREVEARIDGLKARGAKGTTGTQDSFLKLFDGDHGKVRKLDSLVSEKLGFKDSYLITGQTYSRKVDTQVLWALAGIGESCHKFSNDLRLMQHMREMEEPFEAKQKGSSAMPYKRNPMRAERMASLSRYLIAAPLHAGYTSAVQWLERTLDDSAIRRIVIPEAFLTADAVLNLYLDIIISPAVHVEVQAARLKAALPFMATEQILMESVKRGADRQEIHTVIRNHSMAVQQNLDSGGMNDLLERLAADPAIPLNANEIAAIAKTENFIGRAPQQVEEFVSSEVEPLLGKYRDLLGMKPSVSV